MATKRDDKRRKSRITPEQLTEMKQLYRDGHSMTDIAHRMQCHRQTVRMQLTEHKGDIIGDEARKSVLAEEYRKHFADFSRFTQTGLKSMLDASPPSHMERRAREKRKKGPVSLGGMLGLPYSNDAKYMSTEWKRMYRPSSTDTHLLRALREHTANFAVWEPWDRWRKKVAGYETAGSGIFNYLEEKIESDLYDAIDTVKMEAISMWLFGNALLLAAGMELEDLQGFRNNALGQKDVVIVRDESRDADGSVALFEHLQGLLVEIKEDQEFQTLKTAAAELSRKESQIELRRIAREIDRELAAIELMHALPGRCHLCPV